MTREQSTGRGGASARRREGIAGIAALACVSMLAAGLTVPVAAQAAARPGPVEMVADLNPNGHFGIETETVWKDALLFLGGEVRRPEHVVSAGSLWKVTARGAPQRVFTDPPFRESSVRALQAFGDKFFVSAVPKQATGAVRELWISDGTDAGTQRLTFHEEADDPEGLDEFTVIDGTLYFTMEDRDLGGDQSAVNEDVWVSDGTPEGTQKLLDFGNTDEPSYGGELMKLGDRIVLTRRGDEGDGVLQATDGTTEGTELLDHGGGQDTDGGPTDLVIADGFLYYVNDRGDGSALYRTDGTVSGTRQIAAGTTGRTIPSALTPLPDGRLVFRTARPTPALWVTDGTPKGTRLLKKFPDARRDQFREIAASSGKHVVFSVSAAQSQLWRTDGTKAGTKPLTAFTRGERGVEVSPYARDLATQGSRIFFAAHTDGHGAELWSTDATVAGTGRVTDIASGKADSNPRHLVTGLGRIWFLASEATHQQELWRTVPDGPVAAARAKVKAHQKQSAKPSVQVKVGAAERAIIAAKGEVSLPGVKRAIMLVKAKGVVPADKRQVFKLAVKKRDRAKVLKAVRAYRSAPKTKKNKRAVSATVTVTFRGYAGNKTTRTVTIRLV